MKDNPPSTYLPFHKNSFWNDYYTKVANPSEPVEWYYDLTTFQTDYFNINSWDRNSEILILGAGNSKLNDLLMKNQFVYVTMIDFSETLVRMLQEKFQKNNTCDEWDFVCIDIQSMTREEGIIPENFYDYVIDKGCLDCVMCDPNDSEEQFKKAIAEVLKVMKDDGIFFYITTSKPEDRINLLNDIPGLRFKMNKIDMNDNSTNARYGKEFNEADNVYYMYLINKFSSK